MNLYLQTIINLRYFQIASTYKRTKGVGSKLSTYDKRKLSIMHLTRLLFLLLPSVPVDTYQ